METARPCRWAGCEGHGEYRAPKSRHELNSYFWFCLEHIRLYNASWNYYDGMSDEEVDADRRDDTAWNRPTWQLGAQGSINQFSPQDPFGIYGEFAGEPAVENNTNGADSGRPRPHSQEERALVTMELSWPLTLKRLKTQYKKLVKVHHPDANNGNKAAEERFKTISEAYVVLLAHLNEHEKAKSR